MPECYRIHKFISSENELPASQCHVLVGMMCLRAELPSISRRFLSSSPFHDGLTGAEAAVCHEAGVAVSPSGGEEGQFQHH